MPADRPEVLTSLPRSRPTRRSAKRGGASEGDGTTAQAAETKPAAAPKAKAKAAAKPKPKPAAKPKAKPAAARKSKAKAPAKPGPAAVPKTKAKAKPKPKPKPRTKPKPEPVAKASPSLKDFPTEPPSGSVEPPSGQEILQSAAKAAGEIAQAGITVGREAVKSVVKRLPRP